MSSLRIFSPADENQFKEDIYLKLRTNESRVYSIKEIKKLPFIDANNLNSKEWEWRTKSMKSLVSYLKAKRGNKTILELGCGNGWLANRLSKIKGSEVFGVDLNMYELRQAHDAFPQENLHFIYGNIFEDILFDTRFNYIILAASVQYFEDLKVLIPFLKTMLKENGEIHILDSQFYDEAKISDAQKRSKDYFNNLGMPEMSEYYYHHSIKEIKDLGGIQQNKTIKNKFQAKLFNLFDLKNYHIFPWYILKKQD